MSRTLPPARTRAMPRAALAIGVSTLLCGILVLPAPSASAVSPTRTDIADQIAAAEVTLTVAPEAPVLDAADDSYTFTVEIENLQASQISGGTLRLDLNPQRIETAAQLNAAFGAVAPSADSAEGGTDDASTSTVTGSVTIGAVDIADTDTQSTQIAEITVPREDLPLAVSDPEGVYRVQAALVADRDDRSETLTELTADSSFIWQGVGDARTDLAVIVPLVLPTSVQSMPSRSQLNAAIPGFDQLLDAAEDARATLAIDPRIIAAIRAEGESASQQSQRFLRRLETVNLQSFLLQFADADPAVQAALGYTELLQPTGLEYLTSQGSFPPVTVTNSPDSDEPKASSSGAATDDAPDAGTAPDDGSASPAEPAAGSETDTDTDGASDEATETEPTLAQLLAWPQQETPMAWPAEGQVDSDTLNLLANNSITDTVLASSNVTLSGGPQATLGTGRALIAHDTLGDAVRSALNADSDTELQSAAANAAAILAVAATSSDTGMLLALDRGAVASSADTAAVLQNLLSFNWVSAVATTDLATGTAQLTAAAPLEERRELLRSAANQEPNVTAVSALLEQPDFLVGYQRARLLDLFATHFAHDTGAFARATQSYTERDDVLSQGVRAISTEHTQLVGASTRLPIQIKNALPFTAVVTLQVAPESAALSISEREFAEVTVAAEGNSSVLVPVKSRVSSGESALSLTITDASGSYIAETTTLAVTIRSGIETIGMWVLGVLAALLLVFGTVRSYRRRRQRTRDADESAGSEAAPDEAEHESAPPTLPSDPSPQR